MEINLSKVIRSRQPLTTDHVKCFMWQLLSGINYLHTANVIHRDIKPANILVNADCTLKICDFGLATCSGDTGHEPLTEYVVTRWYRPPEVILASSHYDTAVDMWSAGCVFAELMLRSVLFPGRDSVSQMRIICEKLGKPSEDDISFIESAASKRFIKSQKPSASPGLRTLFPFYGDNDEIMGLLELMLKFNPHRRVTAPQALKHSFFSAFQDTPVEVPDFDFANYCHDEVQIENIIDSSMLRDLVWAELRENHSDLPLVVPCGCVHHDTDIELDDSTDFDAYFPAQIVGLMPPPDVISVAQKRPRDHHGANPDSNSPTTKRVSDVDSPNRKDHYENPIAPHISGSTLCLSSTSTSATDLRISSSDSFALLPGATSSASDWSLEARPTLTPVVAHHLVDETNPFSSFARRSSHDTDPIHRCNSSSSSSSSIASGPWDHPVAKCSTANVDHGGRNKTTPPCSTGDAPAEAEDLPKLFIKLPTPTKI